MCMPLRIDRQFDMTCEYLLFKVPEPRMEAAWWLVPVLNTIQEKSP